MTVLPEDRNDVERLLRKAAEDVAVLRLTAAEPALASIACFHAQQAVEKMAKAALTLHGCTYLRNHDLGYLASLLPEAHGPLRAALGAAAWLTLHATSARYGEGADARAADVGAAVKAVAVVEAALAAMGLGLPEIPRG